MSATACQRHNITGCGCGTRPLSERMRDVLRAVANDDVHADGLQRYHGHVNITLRALERRGLIEWPRLLPMVRAAQRPLVPRLTDDGRAELDRINAGSAS